MVLLSYSSMVCSTRMTPRPYRLKELRGSARSIIARQRQRQRQRRFVTSKQATTIASSTKMSLSDSAPTIVTSPQSSTHIVKSFRHSDSDITNETSSTISEGSASISTGASRVIASETPPSIATSCHKFANLRAISYKRQRSKIIGPGHNNKPTSTRSSGDNSISSTTAINGQVKVKASAVPTKPATTVVPQVIETTNVVLEESDAIESREPVDQEDKVEESIRSKASYIEIKISADTIQSSLKDIRDLSWHTEREKAHIIENFFQEINFNMVPSPPAEQRNPHQDKKIEKIMPQISHPQQDKKTNPSDPGLLADSQNSLDNPISLPDAKHFRSAPHGWKSIMGSIIFHHFSECKVKTLSLKEIADLFAIAQNRWCSSIEAIESCKTFDALDKAATSVVAGTPSLLAGNNCGPNRLRGSMDALLFCGAMRLFADWRVLRQIPSGYSTYAAGINLGHKDIVLNVKKIENAARAWMERRRAAHGRINKRPTIRDLLMEEINTNIHTKGLPKLEDDSAATGLLWARRQLEYQHKIYRNANDEQYNDNIRKAVWAAYEDAYGKFHGWAVRKVFKLSAAAAPPLELLIEHMTGKDIVDGKKEMLYFSNVVEPILDDLLHLLHEMNMHDERKA